MRIKTLQLFFLAFLLSCQKGVASWQLIDLVGGGGAPAIAVHNNSGIIYLGSDMGGVRWSKDKGQTWITINRGFSFEKRSHKNIQDLFIVEQKNNGYVFATTTGGILYYSSLELQDPKKVNWKILLNTQKTLDKRVPLGHISVNKEKNTLFVGVGNLNRILLNQFVNISTKHSGKIFSFSFPTEQASSFKLIDQIQILKSDISSKKSLHITAIGATVNNELKISTNQGLFWGKKKINTWEFNKLNSTDLPHTEIIGLEENIEKPNDVVILLNEQSNSGGLYHTTAFRNTKWKHISEQINTKAGLGKFIRSKTKPEQILLIGDAKSPLGLLKLENLYENKLKWTTIVSLRMVLEKHRRKEFKSWQRYNIPANGLKELTAQDKNGFSDIFISGFQGFVYYTHWKGNTLKQIYTKTTTDGSFSGNGLNLMVADGIHSLPHSDSSYIIRYHDNLFFITEDNGKSFKRPFAGFGFATDFATSSDKKTYFLSYQKGNHFKKTNGGGILVSHDKGKSWKNINQVPNQPTTSLERINQSIYSSVYGEGVFEATSADDYIKWNCIGLRKKKIIDLFQFENRLYALVKPKKKLSIFQYNDKWIKVDFSLPSQKVEEINLFNSNYLIFKTLKQAYLYKITLNNSKTIFEKIVIKNNITDICFSPKFEHFFASTFNRGILSSTDLKEWKLLSKIGLMGNDSFSKIRCKENGEIFAIALDAGGIFKMNLEDRFKE